MQFFVEAIYTDFSSNEYRIRKYKQIEARLGDA
jgi:hypothetical protein